MKFKVLSMKKTYVFALIAIFFWSTVSTTAKLLLGAYNNFQVLWISSLFAAIALLIYNASTGTLKKLKTYSFKDIIISVLIGLPGTLFYYLFFYEGTSRMIASQAFIVNYLWPIMSVLFAVIILKEKMNLKKAMAMLMSFAGVVIVMGKDLLHFNKNTAIGAVMCVLGAVSYGLFTSLNQKFKYDKRVSMMLNYFVTFIITGVINGLNGNLFLPAGVSALGFLYNGVLCIAVANTMWLLALENGKTAKVSNLAYITPFGSLMWNMIILKDPFNPIYILGLAVIVAGILIQLKGKGSED
jgi:drug/metabolite transporter (DMT)-like permease